MREVSTVERHATRALVAGDLARAAGLLEQLIDAAHPWRLRALLWVYERLAREAPDPRTRLQLDPVLDGDPWARKWHRARQVTNRAWRAYETADRRGQLHAALAETREELEVWPHMAALRETEARLLVRLGRDEEAFESAGWLHESRPELADLRSSPAYRAWATRCRREDSTRIFAAIG